MSIRVRDDGHFLLWRETSSCALGLFSSFFFSRFTGIANITNHVPKQPLPFAFCSLTQKKNSVKCHYQWKDINCSLIPMSLQCLLLDGLMQNWILYCTVPAVSTTQLVPSAWHCLGHMFVGNSMNLILCFVVSTTMVLYYSLSRCSCVLAATDNGWQAGGERRKLPSPTTFHWSRCTRWWCATGDSLQWKWLLL